MKNGRKTVTNRLNACASTGPKTVLGKARAAQNARSHGLSVPVLCDPDLSTEVESLTREIADGQCAGEIFTTAGRIAEAQVDLQRIRAARSQFLVEGLSSFLDERNSRSKFLAVWRQRFEELASMDRYERRALSRRKFAVLNFDCATAAGSAKPDGQRHK